MHAELNLLEQSTTPLVAPVLSDDQAESLAQLPKAIAERQSALDHLAVLIAGSGVEVAA